MFNLFKNISNKKKFMPSPPIDCVVDDLVSYNKNPITTALKYNNPLLSISIGNTSDKPTYEINLKNSNNEDVGYFVAHVHNGKIEDFSFVAYTDFRYDRICKIPITSNLSFGSSLIDLISFIGEPDENTSENKTDDLYSVIYLRTIENKKYYFEFEIYNDLICAMHFGLSN